MEPKMDYLISRLAFQIEKLDYKFQNIDLLMEALTDRSTKSHYQESPTIIKNYRPNDRLRALGDAVLKMVACQYATMSYEVTGLTKGEWTEWRGEKLMEAKQKGIGRKILSRNQCGKSVEVFLDHVTTFVFTRQQYHEFVKALFGAVFLDSGGCDGSGIFTCLNLFKFLWSGMGYLENVEMHTVQHLFEYPNLKWYWDDRNICNEEFLHWQKDVLQVDFENLDFLCEAIIHPSFYDLIRNDYPPEWFSLPDADYIALEFLGDSVLELVIAEHFCTTSLTKDIGGYVGEIEYYKKNTYLDYIYWKLKVGNILKIKEEVMYSFKGKFKIVESILGAMYLDGVMSKPKEFLLRICELKSVSMKPSLLDLQERMNYKFRDENLLKEALKLKLVWSGYEWPRFDEDHNETNLFIGHTLSLIACMNHEFKYGHVGNKPGDIINDQEMELVLKGIAEFLKIDQLVDIEVVISNDAIYFPSINLGLENKRPTSYTGVLVGILGAAIRDARLAEIDSPIRQMVYRLWNPYFSYTPNSTLLNGSVNYNRNIPEGRVSIFESLIRYNFRNMKILGELLGKDCFIFTAPADIFEKFYRLGYMALRLPAISLELKKHTFGFKYIFTVEETHEIQESIILHENAFRVFEEKKLKYCFGISNRDPKFTQRHKVALITTILGAVYLDMATEEDSSLSKWMNYIYDVLGHGKLMANSLADPVLSLLSAECTQSEKQTQDKPSAQPEKPTPDKPLAQPKKPTQDKPLAQPENSTQERFLAQPENRTQDKPPVQPEKSTQYNNAFQPRNVLQFQAGPANFQLPISVECALSETRLTPTPAPSGTCSNVRPRNVAARTTSSSSFQYSTNYKLQQTNREENRMRQENQEILNHTTSEQLPNESNAQNLFDTIINAAQNLFMFFKALFEFVIGVVLIIFFLCLLFSFISNLYKHDFKS